MKEVTRTIYEAFDGTPHDTKAKCLAHERDNAHMRLIGLTAEDMIEALTGQGEVADAIMVVAYRIRPFRPSTKGKAIPADDEPELPHPIGRVEPMTAEEAEQVRV